VIALRRLRLIGISENYDVNFCDAAGRPRSLAIVAGEITTGKTAVLEFVDFCLGKDRHPEYVEIHRQARSAQLEVELSGDVRVIERPLFTNENTAWLHQCSLEDMEEPHATTKLQVDPAGNPETLNWLLLSHSGLEGIELKEAPTQAVSETDPLSFRDVMWLAFLGSDRLIARHLLHEAAPPMKRIKLRQVIEVIFGVHDQQLASLGDRISLLQSERDAQKAEIQSLRTFLAEQDVTDALEIRAAIEELTRQLEPLQERLESVSAKMRATSDFADSQRNRYSTLRSEAGQAAARVRDRETLLRRLLPLRAQYAEDESKLVFFSEAQRLFDPLSVRVCPSCLEELEEAPEIKDGKCTLCHSVLVPDDEPIDVEAERAAIRARLRAISTYVQEAESELESEKARYQELSQAEAALQTEIDSDISEQLAPFVAQRDELVKNITVLKSSRHDLERQLGWLDGIDRRRGELAQLQARLDDLRAEQRELEENRPSRNVVVHDLSLRFYEILRAFGFPKLDDPEPPTLDHEFIPHVRGVRYDKIGSRGAVTLIALAWALAIFERAIEQGRPHPGFLMIDSPQTNLKPLEEGDGGEDEYATAEIGTRLWHHLAEWSQDAGRGAQLLVVDHSPPTEVRGSVVITFSGDPGQPPYGLIANEIDKA
jgi:septal ring factor EnvC (AmiA/AmiB activator)